MVYWQKRGNKYNSKTTTYKGHVYHSAKEAAYAQELDIRIMAKELESWKRQVRIPLDVNGFHICDYTIDFVEIDLKGHEMYTEIKGFKTAEWRLKWKLFEALFPHLDKQVIT